MCLVTFLLFFSSVGPRIYYMDYFCVSSCFIDWILVFTTFLCFYGIGSRSQFPRRQCKVSCSLPYSLNKEITGLRLFRQDIDTFHGNLGMILLQFSKVYTQLLKTGLPRNRENRKFGSSFFQTGKTHRECPKTFKTLNN